MARIGRPSSYTPALARAVCSAIASGLPVGVACRQHGIARQTLYDWRVQGRAGREPFAGFAARLERATAEAESRSVLAVVKAAKRDWRAAAWMLERRWPQRYALRQTVRVEKAPADMTDAELEAELERLGYVRAEPPPPPPVESH